MADKNETFEFQIKANIKQLQNQLKKIPSMTKEEASKMVRALSSEMRKAQNAAKKAAQESKKTAQITQKEFNKASQKVKKALEQQAKAAEKAGQEMTKSLKEPASSMKSTRTQSRNLGAALGSLEDVVSTVSPELGTLATTVGTAGQGLRALSRSLATGQPIIIAAVAAVGLLAAAYHQFTSSSREAKRQQELMKEVTKKTNERLAEQADIIRGFQKEGLTAQRELLVLTGQMTQLEADIANAKDKTSEAIERDLQIQRKFIVEQERVLEISKKAAISKSSLTDEERKTLELALLSTKNGKFRNALNLSNVQLGFKMLAFQKEVNKELQHQKNIATAIEGEHKKNLNAQIQILEFKNAQVISDEHIKNKEEQKAKAAQRNAKAKAEREKNQAKIDAENRRLQSIDLKMEQKLSAQKAKNFQSEVANSSLEIKMMKEGQERINSEIALNKKVLDNKIKNIEKEKQANIALAETDKQKEIAKKLNMELDNQIAILKDENHLKEMKQSKDRQKELEKEKKSRLDLANEIGTTFSSAAKATSELIKEVSKENHKAAIIAFRVNQAGAIADIAMNTAVQISKFAGNPLAMAAIGAIGAIQAATVLAQSPPEKHMGGMITKGEDTQNITVLNGEAVLDRRTVQRLGGETGINQIQRTGSLSSPEVIIMNPYKHFDRYARSSFKRGGYLSKINRSKASGAY